MIYIFSVDEEMKVPSILIDGKKLAVCNFDLSYETSDDEVGSGHYCLFVTGFLPDSADYRRFRIDLRTKECVEV